jgi:drug/metabolite transporter (DMT)-like permease
VTDKNFSQKFLVAGIVISMFLWGVSWPSGKVLASYCSPFNFIVYRFFVVLITLLPILLLLKIPLKVKKAGIPAMTAAGLLMAAYSYFFYMGVKNGAAGAGGVLVTILNPIMAYTIGMALQRKIPSRNESLGLLLGLAAGCVLLKIWSNTGSIFESGNLYFLSAAFIWAAMSKFTSTAAKHGSSMSFSFWQYLITLLCLLPAFDFTELQSMLHISDKSFWLNLFFSSAIVTTLATTLYFYATTKLGAEKASSYIFLVPFAAALSSWLFLGETIYAHTIVGGLIGIAAVYMINKK